MAPSAEQFRELFMLDPEVTYLNHGSFGAVPRPVFEAQNELRRELELEPVLFLARKLPTRLARVRQSVARFVGAASGDDIGLVPNVTTGLNAVARSIELRRGDEILLTDHEYGAKRILWDEVASLVGAKIVVAPLPRPALSEDGLFDAVAARFTSRTRVLFVSHITSLSALVLPVARLSALAREHGALSIVDGAHGPGQVDLDLPSIGCDIYAGNLHKWVCAPRGSAFVWAEPDAQSWIRGPVVSWNWSWSGPDAFQGRFGWGGTTDPTALLSSRPPSGSSASIRGRRCGGAAGSWPLPRWRDSRPRWAPYRWPPPGSGHHRWPHSPSRVRIQTTCGGTSGSAIASRSPARRSPISPCSGSPCRRTPVRSTASGWSRRYGERSGGGERA